jgi:putative intracellular protease/amidase
MESPRHAGSTLSTVLIPIPSRGFDPTETAVPWKVLAALGHTVRFTTPDGCPGQADPRMVTGHGLGILKGILRADSNGRQAYA